ncbi:MAG: hypothetical protein INR63_32545, partial [Actinomycetospora chiangmaiensis]|nr:hypothetical protein [Actinomycetospora chiangmaiensis]
MAVLRHAVVLSLLLGAAPALAQGPAPNAGSAASPAPAGPIVGGRRVTPTGQTKPPGATAALPPRSVNEAEMIKAQKAAEARSKAWDSKMRNTMGSICHGC